MAFMGITYYVIPLIFRREIAFYRLAKIQPYLFAIGMLVFSMAMTFAGTFGVPAPPLGHRLQPGASSSPSSRRPSTSSSGVMAVGGLIAILGGAIYIVVTVVSVFFGRKMAADDSGLGATGRGLPPGITNPPRALKPEDKEALKPSGRLGPVPGTMVLVFIFLAAFILYYFVNWMLLSFLWEVG